jgi:hypothetical protein
VKRGCDLLTLKNRIKRSQRAAAPTGEIAKHLLSYRLSGFASLIRLIEMQAVRVGKSHERSFGDCCAAKPVVPRPSIEIKTRNHVEEIPLQTVVPRS